MINTKLLSTGSYLPHKKLTNRDLERMVDTNDDWIYSRAGIRSRHIAEDGEYSSDMGHFAALDAISKSGIDKEFIDMIVVATTTPDKTFPATAAIIHKKLGIKRPIPCFDIQAV
jgi:3-oxoacyl-[acyl-carrier-protein] synthase-3